LDAEKLFFHLNKGGCEKSLKKLTLNGNTSLSKLLGNTSQTDNHHMIQFFKNVKSLNHLSLSSCKLSASTAQLILSSIQLNAHLSSVVGFHLDLSSNDIGSSVKSLQNEFAIRSCLTSLDLADTNLDADADILINDMINGNIRSLNLSRNFYNSKTKHVAKFIKALIKLVKNRNSQLQQLWLTDCKLKTNLYDFINELGNCDHLRLLDLTGNDISDFGVNLLSKSLQVNRSIHTLQFDRSNVSPVAYVHIIEALKRYARYLLCFHFFHNFMLIFDAHLETIR
jgi:hypothetical protein